MPQKWGAFAPKKASMEVMLGYSCIQRESQENLRLTSAGPYVPKMVNISEGTQNQPKVGRIWAHWMRNEIPHPMAPHRACRIVPSIPLLLDSRFFSCRPKKLPSAGTDGREVGVFCAHFTRNLILHPMVSRAAGPVVGIIPLVPKSRPEIHSVGNS